MQITRIIFDHGFTRIYTDFLQFFNFILVTQITQISQIILLPLTFISTTDLHGFSRIKKEPTPSPSQREGSLTPKNP